MRRLLLLIAVACASGCALISGLDQYEKGDAESPDVIDDLTTSDVTKPDASGDAQNDVVVADAQDAGTDVSSDASGDAADATDAPTDASEDGDCGALNTVNDCTMCGAKCDGTNATVTGCNGATCQYTCKQNFSNCNSAAPDTNGCECATPSCCGSACATTHANGVGQNYYDCVDAGTYNQTQAGKACTAYTSDQFACQAASCIGDAGDLVVCGTPDGGASCVCWDYTGQDTSHVYKSGSTTCFCPGTTDPTWN
ncbi:MAG TPA: hypothetical protein VGH87_18505 [Polyangiaceae bacterium]|jgi:hypothetical protein